MLCYVYFVKVKSHFYPFLQQRNVSLLTREKRNGLNSLFSTYHEKTESVIYLFSTGGKLSRMPIKSY